MAPLTLKMDSSTHHGERKQGSEHFWLKLMISPKTITYCLASQVVSVRHTNLVNCELVIENTF